MEVLGLVPLARGAAADEIPHAAQRVWAVEGGAPTMQVFWVPSCPPSWAAAAIRVRHQGETPSPCRGGARQALGRHSRRWLG